MTILIRYLNSSGLQVYEQEINREPTMANLEHEKHLLQAVGPPAGWSIVSAELVPMVTSWNGMELPLDSIPNWQDNPEWRGLRKVCLVFAPGID